MTEQTHAAREDHTKVYLAVFLGLLCLTGLTVGVSRFHLPMRCALPIALSIAMVKGGLVGAYFMHLVSERTVIRSVVGISAFFFLFLILLPFFDLTGSFAQPARIETVQAEGGHEAPAH